MKVHSAGQDGTGSNGSSCRMRSGKSSFLKFLDNYLVGRNDPADFSRAWRKKFSKHPSWCDADMCLQQINMGNATGNRVALYSRALFQRLLFQLGEFVQEWPKSILFVGLSLLLLFCVGLKDAHIETDLVQLWVEQGGRLDEEMNFLSNAKRDYELRIGKRQAVPADNNTSPSQLEKPIVAQTMTQIVKREVVEVPTENTFGGGFQVVIQTPEVANENILTREGLLRHVAILEQISQYSVEMFGEHWYLTDICFKPPPPPATSKDFLASIMQDIAAKIIPCVWITPIDCFWEGSKPLGPFPPLDLGPVSLFVPFIPKSLTWRTLNPELLLNSARSLIDVGMVADLFERAGIGAAYQDRPCIDPLDPECPATSPNYFDRCAAYEKFLEWNESLPLDQKIYFEAEKISPRPKRENGELSADLNTTSITPAASMNGTSAARPNRGEESGAEDYYDNDEATTTTESPERKVERQKQTECGKKGRAFLFWLNENRERMADFLDEKYLPVYPNYGDQLTGGCRGFGKNIMGWPEDLIVGGIKRNAQDFIRHAEAFQTVFLVASANDVYQRLKRSKQHRLERIGSFTPAHAGAIIAAWQRNFTKRIYEHQLNKPAQNVRVVHPLASTSIQDMLAEFSEFQFAVIFVGYVLMIIYAGWSQIQWDGWWFSARSSCLLAVIGVLVITFASVGGLGFATMLGIHFNAATTQIVPFLTLGLGIDDMFLLLHNYNDVLEAVRQKEVAVLLKETGMSILITSINNILAFLTGCILPIPALRSFCGQTAILLTSNVICIILIYPAFIALDLKRRKAGYRDMTLGCRCTMKGSSNLENGEKKALEESQMKRKLAENNSRSQLVKSESVLTAHSAEIDLQQMSAAVFGPPSTQIRPMNGNNSGANTTRNVSTKHQYKWYRLSGFLHGYYIPFLRQRIAKAAILLFCAAMFLFGCFGLYRSRIGLELADVLPENTAPAAFLKARERYFSFYPMFIVPKGHGLDLARNQQKLEQLRDDIAKSEFVIKINGKPEPYWMMFMRTWLQSMQTTLDSAKMAGIRPSDDLKKLATDAVERNFTLTDDFFLARRLLCSAGHQYNCTERADVRLLTSDGIVNMDGFYNFVTAWFHADNMMYYVSQAAFFPVPPVWQFTPTEEALIPPADALIYSQVPFYMKGLTDTPAIVEMIKEIRAICDRYTAEGFPVYPSGIPFTFWEQYLHLTYYLVSAILIIGVAVLLVISLIIFNPWAAAMVAIIVVSMTVELAGFMGLFGVKMNPISAVTLITAVGIGVEFTAHVVLAFLTSLGSRDERMVSCLEHMFIPVVHGGLSTLLGIIMLAFSEFDFVVKYFFVVMTALIIIGLINGLALLPVLLSLIGPPCEINPSDGNAVLSCPPSARYRPEDSPTHSCVFRLKKINEYKFIEKKKASFDTSKDIKPESADKNQKLKKCQS